MLGSLILYLKGRRLMMFQLSGFYHKYAENHSTNEILNDPLELHVTQRVHILPVWN